MSSQPQEPRFAEYLLGALAEEEAQRLDEASVIDEEVAEALAQAENDLVDAYVRGELTGPERERFESHYLSTERRREKVLFAQALRDRLEGARTVSPAVPAVEPRAAATTAVRPPIPAWALAAAALVLLVPAGYLLVANGRLRDELSAVNSRRESLENETSQLKQEAARQRAAIEKREASAGAATTETIGKLRIVALVVLPERRGAGPQATVTLGPETDVVALQLRVEPGDESPAYQVTLKSPGDGQVLWKSNPLTHVAGRSGKLVTASVPASLLSEGHFSADLSALTPGKPPELLASYSFRVIR